MEVRRILPRIRSGAYLLASLIWSIVLGVDGVIRSRPLIIVTSLAALAAVMGVAALFVGLVFGSAGKHSPKFPFPVIDSIGAQVEAALSNQNLMVPAESGLEKIQTTYLPITIQTVELPEPRRSGTGGGMANDDGTVLVLAHTGEFLAVDEDRQVAKLSLTAPDNGFADFANSQDGLAEGFDLDLDHFRYNDLEVARTGAFKRLFVSYTYYSKNRQCYTSRLSVASRPANTMVVDWTLKPGDWQTVFEAEPCLPLKKEMRGIAGNMAGGRLAVSPEQSHIYMTLGDYAWDGLYYQTIIHPTKAQPVAQDPESNFGGVTRISLETLESEIVSKGQRNPQGIAFGRDRLLWTVEHGPRGGDELNFIQAGDNLGWPRETYGTGYSGLAVTGTKGLGNHDAFKKPAIAWLPSIGPGGMARIDGFDPAWDGKLLVSTLTSHKLVLITVDQNRVISEEHIDIKRGRRLRYVLQTTGGSIAVLTDQRTVLFVDPIRGGLATEFVEHHIRNSERSDVFKDELRIALNACQQCHSFNPGDHRAGPSLAKVYGEKAGSRGFDGYSPALAAASWAWDSESLMAFILDAQGFAPGTSMPDTGVSDPEVASEIVNVLNALKFSEENVSGY